MFSFVCSSPQRGFSVEAHKLFRHVDAKISMLGPTLTLHSCCGPEWDLHWHQPLWPHRVAAQLCSWGFPMHEECARVVLGFLCKELLSPAVHRKEKFRHFSAPAFNFSQVQRETSFPFSAESQLEWSFLWSPPQFLLSQAKPPPLPCCWGRFTNTPPSPHMQFFT